MIAVIDPGKTTGFVYGNNIGQIAIATEIRWDNRFYFHRLFMAQRDQIETIIIERFKLFPKKETMMSQINSEFPSVRIIGIVEAYAFIYDLHAKIIYQEPNDRLSVKIPQEYHKQLGSSDHVKDAFRHYRYYLLTHKNTK